MAGLKAVLKADATTADSTGNKLVVVRAVLTAVRWDGYSVVLSNIHWVVKWAVVMACRWVGHLVAPMAALTAER